LADGFNHCPQQMGGNLGYKVPIQILKVDFGRFWVLLELVDVAFLTWNQPSL
jgi:hypothetical protein